VAILGDEQTLDAGGLANEALLIFYTDVSHHDISDGLWVEEGAS